MHREVKVTAKELLNQVMAELETGFVACDRCGDQLDTATLDVMPDLRHLQSLLASPQPAGESWDTLSLVNALANIRDSDISAKGLREIAAMALRNSRSEGGTEGLRGLANE